MGKKGLYILGALIALVVAIVFVMNNPFGKVDPENGAAQTPDGVPPEETPEVVPPEVDPVEVDEVAALVAGMSLEEKVGQLIIAGFEGVRITEEARKLVRTYKVGGFIFFAHNLENSEQSLQLLNDVKRENEANQFPLFLSVDQEGGRVTRLPGLGSLPTNEQIAQRNEADLGYQYGTLLGEQLNAFGFQVNFAPSIDVNSNPANQVIGNRSFGSNPELVADLGMQVVSGMKDKGVISSVKHFPGHGDTYMDSHEDMPVVEKGLDELNEIELIPFRRAVAGGVDMVMTAHILLPKLDTEFPATLSRKIVTDLLREDIGFDGVVITDDMTMGAITKKYGIEEAAVLAVNAGVDLVLVAHGHETVVSTIERLVDAVRSGEIAVERMNESVARIIQLKEKYALADEEVESIDLERLQERMDEVLR